jgi:molecular chaperone GrpE
MVKKRKPENEESNLNSTNVTDNQVDNNLEEDSFDVNSEESEQSDKSVSDTSEAENKSFEAKLAEMQDKYLRLSAEFDNYRKRTLREKMDLSKYAGESVLLKIIPLMDDFERALKHMEDPTDCASLKNGIDLIYGKFSEFLKQNGVTEIETMNIPFNVDVHEAVAKVPVEEEDKKGKVIDVVSKGYYLQDKVLRFSKVVVGE